ncbi:MAG: CPBP family intramembrane metalloprotease [Lachnospiraceae bacterium]|nr:CPBP family intramembrane metalloprotease [Lachnospiraceae bacterium]
MNALFLIMVVTYLAVSGVISLLAQRMSVNVMVALTLGELSVLIPGIIFLLLFHCDIAEWIPLKPVRGSTIGFTLLLTLLIQPLLYFLNAFSQLFEKNVAADLFTRVEDIPAPFLLFVIGILGPFCEEAVFRGILFSGFKRSKRIFASILWTAFLFGLFHMNLNQFGYAMVIGIVGALLVEATGSLLPSLIMHIAVNSLNVLQMLAVEAAYKMMGEHFSDLVEEAEQTVTPSNLLFISGALLVPATIATALAVVVYIAILKREGTLGHVRSILPFSGSAGTEVPATADLTEEEDVPKQSVISATGVIGAAICLFLIFAFERIMQLLGQ